jgi:hypothetical protein
MMNSTFGLRDGPAAESNELTQKQNAKQAMDLRKFFMQLEFLTGKKKFSERKFETPTFHSTVRNNPARVPAH